MLSNMLNDLAEAMKALDGKKSGKISAVPKGTLGNGEGFNYFF